VLPAVGQRQSRSAPAYSSLSPTGTMSAYGSQSSPLSTALPVAQPFRNTLTGALGPYTLPSAPAYPSTLSGNYKPLPPMRPLEALARRGRPRWGLRFLMLLIVVGVGTYFLRPYISWIDNRVTPVENRIREIAAQYGLSDLVARVLPDRKAKTAAVAPAPAAPAAPVAQSESTRAAPPAPAAAKPAVAAKAPGARPDIEPISPRGVRGAPAGKPGAGPVSRAAALKYQAAQRRIAAREAAQARRAAALARWRANVAKRRMALASSTRMREQELPPDDEIGGARTAPARPTPAAAAPAAVAEAPVEAPAPKAAAAPPVEKGPPPRSTAVLVKEAASSGDELERLMAGAVSTEKAGPARRDRVTAEIDRKIADVEKGGVQPGGGRLKSAAATASSGAPQLTPQDIKTVMSGVQKQMNTCFRMHGKAGPADVKVEVAPDGSVPGALIRGEFAGTPTGACVQAKIKEATFPASSGLRFDYRLSVR
jgi:hypothetical protein